MILALAIMVAMAPPPKLSSRVSTAVDLDTGEVLYGQQPDRVHAIASISKLAAIRALWKRGLNLENQTTIIKSDYLQTKGGSRSRLVMGRSYSNRDLLHAALLGSDNRAVVALGRSVGLSFKALAVAMTMDARELGMTKTLFVDPTGIDHANVSTPREVGMLLNAVLGIPPLAKITTLGVYRTSAKERSGRPLVYHNTNAMTRQDRYTVLTGKTGFNSAAGWSVAVATKLSNGRRVGIIVLGTPGKYMRFRDARRLHSYLSRLPWSKPVKSVEVAPTTTPSVP